MEDFNLENIFSGGYIEQLKNLSKKCFIYTIDGKDVTEEEFKKFIINKMKEKFKEYENEGNTKENHI